MKNKVKKLIYDKIDKKKKLIKIINNKITIFSITIILSLLCFLSIIITFQASNTSTYEIKSFGNDNYITSIRIGETNYPLERFETSNLKIIDNKLNIKNGDILEFTSSKILNVDIKIQSQNENNNIIVLKNNEKQTLTQNNDTYNYNYNYNYNSRLRDNIISFFSEGNVDNIFVVITISLIIAIILYFCVSYVIKFIFEQIPHKILNIIIFYIVCVLIYYSSIYLVLQLLGWLSIIPLLISVIVICFFYKKEIYNKLHILFAILGIFIGLFMAFTLPPFHVPDEASHFFKAYSIVSDDNVKENEGGTRITKATLNLSTDVQKPIDKYNMDIFNYNYTISAKELFVDMTIFLNENAPQTSFFFGNTYNLPNLCYIPAAIFIYIVISLNLPFMVAPLMARIVNLFVFIISGYFALKITPKYKKVFFAVMLFPITIQQACGINQDSITNSIIFLLTAILFKLIYEETIKVNIKTFISIFIISLLLGFCKIGYYPLLFLVLLIPSNKFKNKKIEYISKFLIIFPCLFLSFKQYFLSASTSTSDITNFYSISTIYRNPILIIKICINTILNRFHLDLLTGLVNGFGWSTVWHKDFMGYVLVTLYFIILMVSGERIENNKHRLTFGIITLLMIGMIYASLLFGWTEIGMSSINGLQCRYFIPVALFFYIACSNSFININIKDKNFFIVLSVAIVNVLCFITIVSRYYI